MNQVCKAETAIQFVEQYSGDWGFDGRDMLIKVPTKRAQIAAKRIIPEGIVKKETIDGITMMVCRF
jgi:hypothetical protein